METNKLENKNHFLMQQIKELIKNRDHVEIYQTSKATIIILEYNNKKYFLKEKGTTEELIKYEQIKKYYKVPTFIGICDNYLVFEYLEDFKNKTINDYLYSDFHLEFDFNVMSSQFRNSICQTFTLMNEKNCESKKFFYERTPKLEKYLKNLEIEVITFNNRNYDIKKIITTIQDILCQNKMVYTFLSQGDPTDTNFTVTGYLTDFENAGYNSILSELSIIFVSLFSHGRYFYPKYNPSAYIINQSILKHYQDYRITIEYKKVEKTINISNIDLKLPSKNKALILDFINIYLTNPNYSKYRDSLLILKYYIGMRILTPLDIDTMEEEDKIIILALLVLVDSNVADLESLKEWISRC